MKKDSTKTQDTHSDLEETLKQIEKQHGKGAVMWLNAQPIFEEEVISTGSHHLNKALGIGGLPRGRIIEIFGPESSGKTTLTLHTIAEAQAAGLRAAFIDAEHAFDPKYAKTIGIDSNSLLISQPDCGEQALDIVESLIRSGHLDIIVIDSVAALTPKAEIDGDMGSAHMGLQARLMSQALRKITALASRQRTTVVFINQLRQKIGVVFGNPETTPGGNALKFYASIRLDVRRIGKLSVGDETLGNRTRVKVIKNKCASPFTEAEFDIRWGLGIDAVSELIDLAEEAQLLRKSGAHYYEGDNKLAQGRENLREHLLKNPELTERWLSALSQSALLTNEPNTKMSNVEVIEPNKPIADLPTGPNQVRKAGNHRSQEAKSSLSA